MKRSILFTFFYLLSCMSLLAGDFYIMQDPNCMDRMVYRDNLGNDMVKYSYRINNTERLFLQVGPEVQARVINYLPNNAFRCGNSFISQNLTKILQNSGNNVYIVKPESGNSYRILKVSSYDYYLQDGTFTVFNGQQYRFSFSPSLVTGGNDLSSNDPRGMVQFEGNLSYGCAQALLFKQRPGISPTSFIDIIFVPQLGVVEQASQQAFNSLKLTQINDETTTAYLQKFCNSSNEFNDRGVVINYDTSPGANSINSNNLNNANATTAKYHIVEKNETLYGLSRKYDINIDQLRNWNGMAANQTLLREGTKLRVSNFEEVLTDRSPNSGNSVGIVQYETPVYNPNINRAGTQPWKTTSGTHIVRPGETINSIAALYGYTPERFRAFNNLAPNTAVREGQILNTVDCNNTSNTTTNNTFNNITSTNNSSLSPTFQNGTRVNEFNQKSPTGTQPAAPNNVDTYMYYSPPTNNSQNQFGNSGNLGTTSNLGNTSTINSTGPTQPLSNPNFGNTNILTPPTTNESDNLFEPYAYDTEEQFNERGGNNINSSNFNVSPSEINNNINANRPPVTSGFGTPIPNTAAPRVQPNSPTRPSFDSPVPGVNAGGTINDPNSAYKFNSTPNNSNTGGASELFNRNGAKRITHTVQQGETIEAIGRKYGISLDRLLKLNNMQKGQNVLPKQKIFLN